MVSACEFCVRLYYADSVLLPGLVSDWRLLVLVLDSFAGNNILGLQTVGKESSFTLRPKGRCSTDRVDLSTKIIEEPVATTPWGLMTFSHLAGS